MRMLSVGMVAVLGAASGAMAADVVETEGEFLDMIMDGYYVEDFDAYTYGSYQEYTLDLAQGDWSYTISASGGAMSFLWSGDGCMSTNSALDGLLVEFTGAPVTAVGGWFYGSDIDGWYIPNPIHIELGDGTSYDFDPASGEDFRGFVSPEGTPIASIWIDAPEVGPNAWSTLDHFYVGSAVPAPGALMLLGLAGLARRRR